MSWFNFLLAIATLAVFWVTKRVTKWFIPWINAGLALVAGVFLARSTPVVWALGWAGAFIDWVGRLFGLDGSLQLAGLVAGIVVLVLAVRIVVAVVFDRKADGQLFNDLIAVSVVAVLAAGPVAAAVTGMGSALQQNGAGGVSRAIGG